MISTRILALLMLFILQFSGVFAVLAEFTMNPVRIGDPPPDAKAQKKGAAKPPALYGWTGMATHAGGTITPDILIEYGVAALAKAQATVGKNTGVWKVGTMVAYTPDRVNVWFGSSVKAEKAANMFDDVFRTRVPVHPAIQAALDACTTAFGGQHNNLGHCAEVMAMNNFANMNPGVATPGANPLIVAIRGSDGTVFSPCGTPIPDPSDPTGTQTVGFDLHDGNTWGCSQFLANLGFTRLHQICGRPGDPTAKRRRSLPMARRSGMTGQKYLGRRAPGDEKKAKKATGGAGGTKVQAPAKDKTKTKAGGSGGVCILIPKPVAAEMKRIMDLLKSKAGLKKTTPAGGAPPPPAGEAAKKTEKKPVAKADKKKAAVVAPPPAKKQKTKE